MAITVWGPAGSSYVWSVRAVLAEKRQEYTLIDVPFGQHREAAHRARHPFAKVPAFEHDGFALYETQAILRYLDQVFPAPPLQPIEPRLRARMNQAIGILDAYGWPAIAGTIMYNRLLAPRLRLPVDEAAVARAVPRAATVLAEWERLMDGRPYLAGPAVSLADFMVAPLVSYLPRTPEGTALIGERPALAAWAARMVAHPSMAATRAER